ncbi:MAG: hypothetical protein GX594_05675 [Pirellulaceae bacterium]|nr:hypothetical protein [Pirellulaceae bacterium]
MKFVAYPLAAMLLFLGIMFVAGSQGSILRIVAGVVFLASAGAMVWIALHKPTPATTTIVRKIDLSGDVSLQDLKCNACGGSLGKESVSVNAGAVFINCQYCGASYQLEEAPKW